VPNSFQTAEAEIQIRTTEFDSQPKTLRIVGSAAPFSGFATDINDFQPKTLLTSTKSNQRQTQKLKKLPDAQVTTSALSIKSVKLTDDE
jgi:hypothetical protein